MRKIRALIGEIGDEIRDATCYAERYLEHKTKNPSWGRMYHDMAEHELMHAENLRSIGQAVVDELPWLPENDMDEWEDCGYRMNEGAAMVRLMLSK